MYYIPNIVEIVEKEIVFDSYSLVKLREVLNKEVSNQEYSGKAVFIQLKFTKVTESFEKKVIALFNEEPELFNLHEYFSNNRIVFINIEGDFNYDFSNHNSLKEGILEKVTLVNKEYQKKQAMSEKQQLLPKKKMERDNFNVRVLTYELQILLANASKYQAFLFNDNVYNNRADLDINVDFQREIVWTLEQKQELIKSLLMDMPIGNFYINNLNIYSEIKKDPSKTLLDFSEIDGVLYDGKQRINAILEYISGEFSVTIKGEIYFFGNLYFEKQHDILNTSVNIYETSFNNKNDLIDYYILINKNQTQHKQEDFDKALKFKK